MRDYLLKGLALALLALLLPVAVVAGERVALVIGNNAYQHGGALNSAVNDAQRVGDALQGLGFRVIRKQNLGYTALLDALDELGKAAADADWAVVYYAGHGIQVQGKNHLIPVDLGLNREGDLRRTVLLDDLLAEVNQARELGLVILDACRDNPFAARLNQGAGRSVAGRGLARVEQTGGNTLVAFATREDTIAADSGVYATALVEHLATPGLDVHRLFGKVRDAVMARTGNTQIPYTYGSLGGGYYAFKPGPSPPSDGSADRELVFWNSVKDSRNPAVFRIYLDQYPGGTFAKLAQIRLAELEPPKPPPVTPPSVVAGKETGKEYKASHILVDSEKKAKEIIIELKKGGNFAKLAKAKSSDSSAANGGDLGWFTPSMMVLPFAEAVAKMEKGKYSEQPVQTPFGWHVILLEDIRDATDGELVFWNSVKDSQNPADFRAYLDQYPGGTFARLAQNRLAELEPPTPPSVKLTEGTIKIAVAGPITGPVAQYGDMQMIGAKMAVEQINVKGGVNGKQLEAVLMDDMCTTEQAVAIANQIVNQKIKYVVGHLCSNSSRASSQLYEEKGILMITPGATNPIITQQGYRMVFRSIGTDDQQGPIAGQYIVKSIKPKRLVILHEKQQYGEGIAKEVRKTVEAAGIKPVLFEGVNKGQTDFSALITKMKKEGVDFVYYGGYQPELGRLLRQSREQGFDARYMGPEGVGNKDISAIAGPASEGLLVTLPADFSANPTNADLVNAFRAKNQDPSGLFVMPAYTAVQIIADAIRGARTEDPVLLADYLRKSNFQTPIGKVAFKENGDLKESKYVIFIWHADATKTVVK